MIVYPINWRMIGVPISIDRVEQAILSTLSRIDCDCLSLSGGVDSCLLLYYLLTLDRKIRTFTITCSLDHPDIHYSQLAVSYFKKLFGVDIVGNWRTVSNVTGDSLVRSFYSGLKQHTDSIIAGDGIDEFMCGYYAHQRNPTEETYFDYLGCLQVDHLNPLNENSGDVKVYLPYLSEQVTNLLWQIPLSKKVDTTNRKKLIVELAKDKMPDEIIERRKYGLGTGC